MTESLMIKLICSNHGSMDYGDLVDIGSGLLDVKGVIDTVIGNDQFSVVTLNGNKRVVAKTKVRLCKARECTDCRNLHLCKFYLFGDCRNSKTRRGCRFCHDIYSEHNATVLQDNNLHELDRSELCTLLLQNDSTLLPPVCFQYNKGDGEYGNCSEQESCRRIHICDRYLRGTCTSRAGCLRSHDFFEPQPLKTLQERWVPNEMIGSMLCVYQNIQAIKMSDNSTNRKQQTPTGNVNSSRKNQEKTEICLYFVKGTCKQEDRCWREHSSMPYKWEIRTGDGWSALPDNEEIERDFCVPANVCSRGTPPVHFGTMTRGSAQVRRLSTVSSVLQPTFVLTTKWAWYWEDEYNNWIQYASLEGQHRLSSITSEELEGKYLEDSNAVVEFSAGKQAYRLSFQDMIQTNEKYGTQRRVKRRPVFVSTADARTAKTSKNRPVHNFKAVPGYWDKSMLPDTGYKKVTLLDSSEDYKKILGLFQKTMRGYGIQSVERVQNRTLWEVFQWQKDLMRKNNGGRNVSEKQLFHGTDSKHIDAICKQNFDWRICGTHGTAYGRGSYFARDAKYSHSYTGSSGMKTMFVCRVLVGCYTKGDSSYLRPPSRDGGDSVFYDSCVDNVHDPSIFVVFEKHQVYPEYLIKYDEDMWFPSALSTVTTSSFGYSSAFSSTSNVLIPTQAPPPISAGSVYAKPVQAPSPVSASSVISKPVQAPSPVSASSVISKPVPAPYPVSASSVYSKPVQAPSPVSASSVISKPVQAPPPISASSVISKPVQAPPPISASSVISKPVQAPPPTSASSVYSKPVHVPSPVSASSVISKPVQAPSPVSASSVISKPVQAPRPISASSVYFPPTVSTSSVISRPAPAPAPVHTSSVISKPRQASIRENNSVHYHTGDWTDRFSNMPSYSTSSTWPDLSSSIRPVSQLNRSSPTGSSSFSQQRKKNDKDCTIL
ncbi:protein mono-ADP-ribosyltransferase PARP12-like isoform X2 [Anguilla rostrata]|uniref:protein mono-ADP-ribosyltransferase PARP12-like isoform X2 n=1 Tax=Anguilla rostrata TaxID=7938 RepID=UPI0030D26011